MRASLFGGTPHASQCGPPVASSSRPCAPLPSHALRRLHTRPRMQAQAQQPAAVQGSSSGGHHAYSRTEDELDGYEPWVEEQRQDALRNEQRTQLRLFLDAASPTELEKWAQMGMFYGFTTNPTILKRDKVPCSLDSLRDLTVMGLDWGYQEVQLQAWGPNLSAMAEELASIDPRVVVKLPCTMDGIQAAAQLRDKGARTTITGVYYPYQALVAQSVGASYVAPYLGRMGDAFGREEGFSKIVEIQQIINGCQSGLRSLVASIRSPEEIAKLAAKGGNTFTFSPDVARALFDSPLTLRATGQFEADAQENC